MRWSVTLLTAKEDCFQKPFKTIEAVRISTTQVDTMFTVFFFLFPRILLSVRDYVTANPTYRPTPPSINIVVYLAVCEIGA